VLAAAAWLGPTPLASAPASPAPPAVVKAEDIQAWIRFLLLFVPMRRAAVLFLVALSLLGCAAMEPPGEPVALLTGSGPFEGAGCYTFQITTKLVPDPKYGTVSAEYGSSVMWRPGHTGRRLDSGEVVVRDGSGQVVATTGSTDTIGGGGFDYNGVSVFWACSHVIPEPT
jgi:hypothetical protein